MSESISVPVSVREQHEKMHARFPGPARILGRALRSLDYFFDKVYGSDWNPLHQSGVLAVGLLVVIMVTGTYLLFFYKIGAPYESMVAIQQDVWLSRWIRTLHRYASDACVVAVLFHVIRMMVEAKTWGPRLLAWVSGVFITGILLLSGWTGFVMMWDRHGQELAISGARMFDYIAFFTDPMSRLFVVSETPSASFFFMNLFLHVALPLGMFAGIWVHTSRLNRPLWFPKRSVFWAYVGGLLLLSILMPAPLGEGADLLSLGSKFPVDWFYSFWLPVEWNSTIAAIVVATLVTIFLFSIPAWWRPFGKDAPAVSVHDESKCEGCTQCFTDCPFEAINMVPRTQGTGSELVAHVDPSRCVGCGVCSASCQSFAIGPVGKTGREQLQHLKELKGTGKGGIAVVSCSNNAAALQLPPTAVHWPFDCIGAMHSGVVTGLLNQFDGVFVLGCPPSQCITREGQVWSVERLFAGRRPSLPSRVELDRVHVCTKTVAELSEIQAEFKAFENRLKKQSEAQPKAASGSLLRLAKAAPVSAALLYAIGWASGQSMENTVEHSSLRLEWRLAGQAIKNCKTLTPEELAARPAHMRTPTECTNHALSYKLKVSIDGKEPLIYEIAPKGMRADRPLIVDREIHLEPKTHSVNVEFTPLNDPSGQGASFRHSFEGDFQKGRALLVVLDPLNGQFRVSGAKK